MEGYQEAVSDSLLGIKDNVTRPHINEKHLKAELGQPA